MKNGVNWMIEKKPRAYMTRRIQAEKRADGILKSIAILNDNPIIITEDDSLATRVANAKQINLIISRLNGYGTSISRLTKDLSKQYIKVVYRAIQDTKDVFKAHTIANPGSGIIYITINKNPLEGK